MITGYSIEQVLPHTAPMILLDNFIEAGENHAICTVTIKTDSPFYDEQSSAVPSYVGIEYMAQTIAAYSGANNLNNGGEVKVGFLLGCRKYQPSITHFDLGTTLDVKVTQLVTDESGLSVFDCIISHENQVIVEAKLNVFEPKEQPAWPSE